MARTIIAVIVGYISMFVLVSLTITCAFLLMGTDWSFKPGSFEASNGWIAMSLVANLIIAIVGGFILRANCERQKSTTGSGNSCVRAGTPVRNPRRGRQSGKHESGAHWPCAAN